MTVAEKCRQHAAFWEGRGPSLILIPPGQQVLYDLRNYPARFRDPRAMWASEIERAAPVVDWPTDGVPTVRPNLGVVFVPAMGGLDYRLPEDAMPWPGEPRSRDALRAARGCDVARSETMRLAAEFYALHRNSGRGDIVAYQADTQGVFDIAHLLYGEQIFLDLADPDQAPWIDELLESSLELYVAAVRQLKDVLGEPEGTMIHGHGTSQGVLFPGAGTRLAEDTAILLSPAMIERVIVPVIRRAAAPFGGAFVHFCGKHLPLLARLCALEEVAAIDLGNPELYDTRRVLELAAASSTVVYSRLAAEPGETWEPYLRRLAGLVRDTGARVILRPMVVPESRDDCEAMRDLWHELTSP